MSTSKMSNRKNVEHTKCRQTKDRTDKMSTDKMHVTPCMQNTEETIAKYAVDANLFQLGSSNPEKNIQPLDFILVEAKPPTKQNIKICKHFFFNI